MKPSVILLTSVWDQLKDYFQEQTLIILSPERGFNAQNGI